MKKLLVSVDIEGIAGVSSFSALTPKGWEWSAARRWMTNECNAVLQPAFEAGFDEIIVTDSHGCGLGLDPDILPDNVRLVRAWPRPFIQMHGIDDPDVTACAFIGYHAGASSPGLFSHTFSGAAYRALRLNGEPASEGYFNAALAGSFGKPVLFVSGDQHVVEDAKRYAPHAATYITKNALNWSAQSALPPRQVCREIETIARRAFQSDNSKPFVLKHPYELIIEFNSQNSAEVLCYTSLVERIDSTTVRATFESVADAMRFVAFAAMYSPSGRIDEPD
jgi:D-amino peptidase